MYRFKTKDHPEANGRQPKPGEIGYRFFFPLEDGNVLVVHTGEVGKNALAEVLRQAETQAAELPT